MFAVSWDANVISNVGGWMYSAASGWLMTSLNPSPLIVSLVQVVTSLPYCLFALPAGALAYIVDRRKRRGRHDRFLISACRGRTASSGNSTELAASYIPN